jgi:hypothetical protein
LQRLFWELIEKIEQYARQRSHNLQLEIHSPPFNGPYLSVNITLDDTYISCLERSLKAAEESKDQIERKAWALRRIEELQAGLNKDILERETILQEPMLVQALKRTLEQ